MAGLTACKQALHDLIATCLVIERVQVVSIPTGQPAQPPRHF